MTPSHGFDYPERVYAFHFRNIRGQVPTEDPSDGEIDVPFIVREAVSAGFTGWLGIEL